MEPERDPLGLSIATEDAILRRTRDIAVVGIASKAQRASHRVSRYMQAQGYRLIFVNPREVGPILGERVYPTLADVPDPIGLVDVFQRPERTDAAIDAAIAVGAKAVWLQLGIRNDAGIARARRAGLAVVQDRCLMESHRRWVAAGGQRDD